MLACLEARSYQGAEHPEQAGFEEAQERDRPLFQGRVGDHGKEDGDGLTFQKQGQEGDVSNAACRGVCP